MNIEAFWVCVFVYFMLGVLTFGFMTIDAKCDNKGCFTRESCYKMFWGCTFWPITWVITVAEFLYMLCIEAIKLPRFIADAFMWGVKSLKIEKKPKEKKTKVFHDKDFNQELCRMMYDWEDSEEPAQDIALKHEGEVLQAAFKVLQKKIKITNEVPEEIAKVDLDELFWGDKK